MINIDIAGLKAAVAVLEERVAVLEGKREAPESPVDAFDVFWSLYPRKVGKPLARRAFEKAKSWDEIIHALENWIRVGAFNTNPKYIHHASTWLNQKCYNDDPVPYTNKFTKPQIGGAPRARQALDEWLNSDERLNND